MPKDGERRKRKENEEEEEEDEKDTKMRPAPVQTHGSAASPAKKNNNQVNTVEDQHTSILWWGETSTAALRGHHNRSMKSAMQYIF